MRGCPDAPSPPVNISASQSQCPPVENFVNMNTDNFASHVIANVQFINPVLPMINIHISDLQTSVLLDTGSSISIISHNFFNMIKHLIKIKYLSRQVKISTVNSVVNFSSCVEFSFKIEAKHFKHQFYVISITDDTTFSAILGYDFLKKYRVQIDPSYTKCIIDDLHVPFVNNLLKQNEFNKMPGTIHSIESTYNSQEQDSSRNNYSSVNLSTKPKSYNTPISFQQSPLSDISSNSDTLSCKLVPVIDPDPPTNCNSNAINNTLETPIAKVKTAKKVSLEPKEKVYVRVTANIPSNVQGDCIFIPLNSNQCIEIYDTIFNIQENQSSSKFKIYHFNIFLQNISESSTFIHKNQILGNLFLAELKPNTDTSVKTTHEAIHTILPTDEVINLRRKEFNIQDFKITHLSTEQQNKLTLMLQENFSAFSSSLKSLGHSDLVTPNLKFNSDCNIKCLPFPVPHALQDEAKRQLHDLVEAGIIKKNLSNWAAPMLLVKKKSTTDNKPQAYRLALDLRLINNIIEGSSYPLPKIQDLISQLAKFKFFTSLDMPSAYHQIHLPEQYQDQLSFATPWATYKYLRLVFGLKTASQYFQSLADNIIEEIAEDGIFAYQDDFIIGSHDFDSTYRKLLKLLKVFQKHNLTLNAKKCSFHQESVQYLGFEINHNKVSPISSNIIKINSFPTPKSKRHVKRFLGLCGYYRSLIPKYADLTDPLIKLTSPKTPFIWTESHQKVFSNLQQIFFKKPFLIQPDFNQKFYLNTDASKFAISAILMQMKDNKLLPVSYYSKTLKPAEQRYPALKRELMAIVKGVTAFKYYLFGRHFCILSDSKPLKTYAKVESPTDLTTRWLMTLAEYNYTFTHLPGKDNILADFFSRTPFPDSQDLKTNPDLLNSSDVLPMVSEDLNFCSSQMLNSSLNHVKNIQTSVTQDFSEIINAISESSPDPLLEISNSSILKEQLKDNVLARIYNDILNQKKYPERDFFCICPSTKLLLFIKDPNSAEEHHPKIALPKSLRNKALRIAHVSHFGINKTYESLTQKYYWRGMYADTVNFVQSCIRCATAKSHRIPAAPFQNNKIPTHPGDYISLDLVGPFRNGFHILTIIDHFSRFLQLYPLKSITSENVIKSLFKYISTHGRPSLIQADLGVQFTSRIFNDFTYKYGIRLTHASVSHPQSNGISERINQSIKSTISALQQEGYDFHNAILIHQMLYNSSVHSSTKFSPNQIHFGRKLSTLYDTKLFDSQAIRFDSNHTFFQLMQDLDQIYTKVHENLLLSQSLQNQRQHQKAKLRDIKVGDMAYLKSTHTFKPFYEGPYEVVEKSSPVLVILQRHNSPNARRFKIHIDRIWVPPPRKQYLQPDYNPDANTIQVLSDSSSSLHHDPQNVTRTPTAMDNSSTNHRLHQASPSANRTVQSQNSNQQTSTYNVNDTVSSNINNNIDNINSSSISVPPSHPYFLRSCR